VIRRSDASLLLRWVRARFKILLRGPRGAFFTFIFPLIFLIIFDAANKGSSLSVTGGKVDFVQFYTPGIAVFAVTTSCYQGLIILVANLRDQGILKRVRGTPLPPWIYLTALVSAAILAGLLSVLLMFVVAVPAFGMHIYWKLVPAAIVTLLLGAAAITAIALSVSCFVDRPESAQPIAGITLFPLLFVSGVFYPLEGAPDWLQKVAHVFPLSHLAQGFEECFSPHTAGLGFSGKHLTVLALWWIGGTIYAARHFRWEKRPGGGGGLARRHPRATPAESTRP
jgi:ABC-2 type transport system permease protein